MVALWSVQFIDEVEIGVEETSGKVGMLEESGKTILSRAARGEEG